MPGLESCGRCGTSLSFRAATIDVNPPRASKTAKRLRKIMPHETFYRARDLAVRVRAAAAGSTINDSRVPLPEPAILSPLIVPGWAHIHSGLVIRGRFFLAAYLVLIVLGLWHWGTLSGSIFLGLAFSVHASSVWISWSAGDGAVSADDGNGDVVSLVLAVAHLCSRGVHAEPDCGAD